MNEMDRERLYREMAGSYAESYGALLKRELGELEASGAELSSGAFDEGIRKSLRARKRRTAVWISLAAACVLLLALLPVMLDLTRKAPNPDASSGDHPLYEVMPLGFELPEGFSVTKVEQDIERTVYYLNDPKSEGVVMTLEKAEGPVPHEGLDAIQLGGKQAYGLETEDYGILLIQDGGILYTMTCGRGMGSLLELGGSI